MLYLVSCLALGLGDFVIIEARVQQFSGQLFSNWMKGYFVLVFFSSRLFWGGCHKDPYTTSHSLTRHKILIHPVPAPP